MTHAMLLQLTEPWSRIVGVLRTAMGVIAVVFLLEISLLSVWRAMTEQDLSVLEPVIFVGATGLGGAWLFAGILVPCVTGLWGRLLPAVWDSPDAKRAVDLLAQLMTVGANVVASITHVMIVIWAPYAIVTGTP